MIMKNKLITNTINEIHRILNKKELNLNVGQLFILSGEMGRILNQSLSCQSKQFNSTITKKDAVIKRLTRQLKASDSCFNECLEENQKLKEEINKDNKVIADLMNEKIIERMLCQVCEKSLAVDVCSSCYEKAITLTKEEGECSICDKIFKGKVPQLSCESCIKKRIKIALSQQRQKMQKEIDELKDINDMFITKTQKSQLRFIAILKKANKRFAEENKKLKEVD